MVLAGCVTTLALSMSSTRAAAVASIETSLASAGGVGGSSSADNGSLNITSHL